MATLGSAMAKLDGDSSGFVGMFQKAADLVQKFTDKGNKGLKEFDNATDRTKVTLQAMQNRMESLNRTLEIARYRQSQFNDETSKLEKMRVAAQISNTENAIANLANRMRQTANDGRGLHDRLDGIKNAMSQLNVGGMALASTIGNVVSQGFWRAVDATKEFVGSLFAAASATEMQAKAFKVLTGSADSGAKLMGQINDLATQTPYTVDQLRGVTKTMLSFGIGTDEVIDVTRMLGDITAGTGGDLTLLGRAFGQVKTKGKLYAQELNQLGEQGLAVREIIADKLGVSVADLIAGMENGKITVPFEQFNDIVKDIHKKKFLNLMAEQAKTMAGRFENLKEQASLVGQEILGISTTTGEIIPGSVIDHTTKRLQAMLDYLAQNKQAIIDFGRAAVKSFFDIIDSFQKLIELAKTNDSVKAMFIGLAFVIGVLLAGAFWSAATAAWAMVVPLLPFVAIALLIGSAVGLIWLAWETNFWGIRDGIMWLYNKALVPLWDFLVAQFVPAWQDLSKEFNELWIVLKPLIDELWTSLKPALMEIWKVIQPYLLPALGLVAAVIVGPVLIAIGLLVGGIYLLIKGFTWLAKTAREHITSMKLGWNNLLLTIGLTAKWFTDTWNTATSFVTNKWNELMANVNLVIGLVRAGWDALVNFFQSSTEQKFYTIGYIIGFVIGTIINQFIWLYNTAIATWNGIVNWAITSFNYLMVWFSTLPAWFFMQWELIKMSVIISITSMVFSAIALFNWLWSQVVLYFNLAKQSAINALQGIVGFVQGLPAQIGYLFDIIKNNITNSISTAVNNVRNLFQALSQINLVGIGRDIIAGLIRGISSMIGAVQERINAIANGIKDGIKNALQIGSPSKVMEQFGKWTIQGLDIGMQAETPNMQTSLGNSVNTAIGSAQNMVQDAAATNQVVNNNTGNSPVTNVLNFYGMTMAQVEEIYRKYSTRQNTSVRLGTNRAYGSG